MAPHGWPRLAAATRWLVAATTVPATTVPATTRLAAATTVPATTGLAAATTVRPQQSFADRCQEAMHIEAEGSQVGIHIVIGCESTTLQGCQEPILADILAEPILPASLPRYHATKLPVYHVVMPATYKVPIYYPTALPRYQSTMLSCSIPSRPLPVYRATTLPHSLPHHHVVYHPTTLSHSLPRCQDTRRIHVRVYQAEGTLFRLVGPKQRALGRGPLFRPTP